jgi:hypothetical protein
MQTQGLMQKGVPPMPSWLFFIKIAILVLSLIILALAAWSISIFGSYTGVYYYGSGSGGLLIFACVKTFIIYGAQIAVEKLAPHMFFRAVAVVLCVISIIFWLSAWAWAASSAGAWLSLAGYDGFYDGAWKKEGSALAACAGLGALVWILSIVHLVFLVQACQADPEGKGSAQNQAELGQVHHKQQEAPAEASYGGQTHPQQTYPQQTYASQ